VRLGLVLRGKRLGFPLEEIRRIVDMYDDVPGEAGQLEYLLGQIDERRAELEARRADIEAALAELDDLQRRCRADLGALTTS
jgi:DNA-binding transcriptional MerR regulator